MIFEPFESNVTPDRRLNLIVGCQGSLLDIMQPYPWEAINHRRHQSALAKSFPTYHSRSSRILPRTTSLTWHLSFRCLMQGHCPCTKASAWIKGTLSRITITKSKRQVRQPIHHDTRESSQNWHLSFRCLTISIDKSKTPTASWRANDCGH